MTKLKYPNEGGRGFHILKPLRAEQEGQAKVSKNELKVSKKELLLRNTNLEHYSVFVILQLIDYRSLPLSKCIKVLLFAVNEKTDTFNSLKRLRKDNNYYNAIKVLIGKKYKQTSTAALKITIEENKNVKSS